MAKYQHSFALKLRFYIFQFLVILTFFLQVPSKFRSRVWKILCGYWLSFDFVDLSVFRSFSGMILLFWLGWLNNSNSSDTFRLASLMRCWRGKEKNTGVLSILTNNFHLSIRLFILNNDAILFLPAPPISQIHLRDQLRLLSSSDIQRRPTFLYF